MKTRTFEIHWKTILAMSTAVLLAAAIMLPNSAMAADNIGTGDIAGDSASLNSSNTFSLFTTIISLNKMAFLTDGTKLTSGAILPRGTEVQFVIYINNSTAFGMSDISVQDVLDPAFAYQAGTMKADNTLATTGSETLIYNTVNAVASTFTDAINDDQASAVGVTIDVGNSVVAGNTQVDVNPNSVWSFLFRALMQ